MLKICFCFCFVFFMFLLLFCICFFSFLLVCFLLFLFSFGPLWVLISGLKPKEAYSKSARTAHIWGTLFRSDTSKKQKLDFSCKRLTKGLHNHTILTKDPHKMTVKIYRYFSHKSDILHYLIYHQQKNLRDLDLPYIASEVLQANTHSGWSSDVESERHKRTSTFLERGSQSGYIVNSKKK